MLEHLVKDAGVPLPGQAQLWKELDSLLQLMP